MTEYDEDDYTAEDINNELADLADDIYDDYDDDKMQDAQTNRSQIVHLRTKLQRE